MSFTDTVEAQDLMRTSFSHLRYGSVKGAQRAAYDFMKSFADLAKRDLKFRRIRQIWEGKAVTVAGWEKDALRRAQIEEARNEYTELKRRLESLEAALAVADASPFGAPLAAHSPLANGVGRMDRP